MDKKSAVFYFMIVLTIFSLLSVLFPIIYLPFIFLFFPFVFRGSSTYQANKLNHLQPQECQVCGYKLKNNWKYCPSCSQPIVNTSEEDEQYFSQYR